jgi:hypothetical protein
MGSISIPTALAVSAAASAGSSVIGGALSSSAAGKAADTQAAASIAAGNAELRGTEEAIAENQRQYDLARQDLTPFRQTGVNALRSLAYYSGLPTDQLPTGIDQAATAAAGPVVSPRIYSSYESLSDPERDAAWQTIVARNGGNLDAARAQFSDLAQKNQLLSVLPNTGTTVAAAGTPGAGASGAGAPSNAIAQFQTSPGYQFRLDQGMQAIDRSAASRGRLMSGATLKAAQGFGQGLATDEFGNFINRLQTLAGVGQSATNTGVAAGEATAGNIGNAAVAGGNAIGQGILGAGQARASGYVGSANAIAGGLGGAGSALQSGANNYLLASLLKKGGGAALNV